MSNGWQRSVGRCGEEARVEAGDGLGGIWSGWVRGWSAGERVLEWVCAGDDLEELGCLEEDFGRLSC